MENLHLNVLMTTPVRKRHALLLADNNNSENSTPIDCLTNSPLFTTKALARDVPATPQARPSQCGLLAALSLERHDALDTPPLRQDDADRRLFFNVTTPSSIFICGSQGSGKSHTLSCLLENCLADSNATILPRPLSALLFHYDTFISDDGGSPCEAAFLASLSGVQVRVVCAPTNIRTIQKTYQHLNVNVEPLQIDSYDLNTKRILDLMAVKPEEGSIPLYVHTVSRILREMRMSQQATGARFDYQTFKTEILAADLSPAQLAPLNQRLAMLESFMPPMGDMRKGENKKSHRGTTWKNQPGLLTIVDLSCPCVSPETACSLFNICLSLFLEQKIVCGRVVALDEAHKYMTSSPESSVLTNSLLSTVRLQRHLGARIFVSTQEPTIAPAFLDLCTVTIIHRFSSPAWLHALDAHIALMQQHESDSIAQRDNHSNSRKETAREIFKKIIQLKPGEALVFAPSAMTAIGNVDGSSVDGSTKFYMQVRIRSRLSDDGGCSVLAG
ncbi:hypothetical protein COCSADRAFT_41591 [Bipolaris sorokiniana ND90Pr]|uniref:AAA+ ATPase domain-containing protein n=1 Tax=Cochliobolus sativus (strain ND90Pr / ATCC 201652) TaxID=665912 RepID=M2QV73_COCSN|nr:uncharacterized protein COCSADRAFT_41591 [Bipolaris sorokiniana ND90Pr]EMD59039.1 hypothetical protein COCSADRAFT_41591 [Bipolaris sorokiniana ND90Pr]